jgi:hypothetical protein
MGENLMPDPTSIQTGQEQFADRLAAAMKKARSSGADADQQQADTVQDAFGQRLAAAMEQQQASSQADVALGGMNEDEHDDELDEDFVFDDVEETPSESGEGEAPAEWEDAANVLAPAELSPDEEDLAVNSQPAQTSEPTPPGYERHVVKDGECTTSIAHDYGHFWKTLWQDSANTELSDRRVTPNVLFPQDVMMIPP